METNRVLVLHFDDDTKIATCFDRNEKRTLKIRVDLDTDAHPGQFIHYLKAAETESVDGVFNATHRNAKIEHAKQEDYVKVGNGQLMISSWIGFSDNPNHKTFDRSVAFADWYGLVDNSKFKEEAIRIGNEKNKRLFTSTIVLKDLNYLENDTQLFEVYHLKFAIVGAAKENEVQQYLKNLDSYEEVLAASEQRVTHPRNSSSDSPRTVSNPQTQQVFDVIQNRGTAMARTASASVIPTPSIPQPAARNVQPRPSSVVPQTTSASSPQFEICQMAIAMTRSSLNEFVVWMADRKAVATLNGSCRGAYMVRLGATFECVYHKKADTFVVSEVRRMIERTQPFPVRDADGQYCEAQLVVDLCTPNFKFDFWTIYTGIAVMNAEEVGMVTVADKIEVPGERMKRFYEVMRIYMGEPRSKRMVCHCRLEEQRLPRMVVDPGYEGFEIVSRFHWKLCRVVATMSNAERMDIEQRMSNLGVSSADFELTDDVARYKRELQQNNFYH